MNEVPVPETVVIGVGNPLMGDDGLGIAALERLRNGWHFEPHLDLLDGGTWGLNLLPHVERAQRVLFIDAINADAEPGALVELEREDIPRFLARKLSPHQIDVKEVLALAELRGTLPRELVAIGLQPESVEMRASLSPVLESRVGDLVARVIDRLDGWGYAAIEREGDTLA
jgi:hydrogenase maturation protease